MAFVDDLNQTSRQAFINSAISAVGALFWLYEIVVSYQAQPPRPATIKWIAFTLLAVGTVYMFYRGCQLRKSERRKQHTEQHWPES